MFREMQMRHKVNGKDFGDDGNRSMVAARDAGVYTGTVRGVMADMRRRLMAGESTREVETLRTADGGFVEIVIEVADEVAQ